MTTQPERKPLPDPDKMMINRVGDVNWLWIHDGVEWRACRVKNIGDK